MKKAEFRTHKNQVYFLWQVANGWVFFIRELEAGSQVIEKKEDAMSEARKKIEIAVLEKKFGRR